ncbi:right-handed parallel beta-helix repeat-containing protein [Paenibacillus sp. GCM10023252]|uniref:right-handed parallel beta-helix repeat-containing protein n=1 Tax=Paenibacillus sp. GCM10023252 TaxID=3252649 RepID=UPI0036181930
MTTILQDKLTLHVQRNGNDHSTEGPLASLAGARNRIRELRASGAVTGPIEVILHTGRYEVRETIHFDQQDLAVEDSPVTFRAAGDGEVVLVGGCLLRDPQIGENGMLEYNLSKLGLGCIAFDQLFCNGERMRKARYPKFDADNPYGGGWLYVDGPVTEPHQKGIGARDRFICKDPRLLSWSQLEEVELFIFPRHNWYNSIVKLKSYDPETGEVVLKDPVIYEIYPGDRFYFQSVKEELQAPGEWYLDEEKQRVMFIPPAHIPLDQLSVVIPLVKNIIEVRSQFDQEEDIYKEKIDWQDRGGYLMKSRQQYLVEEGHLSFKGLTLEGCEGTALFVKRAKGIRLEGCVIRGTGGPGVTVLQGVQCQVLGCDIYETGSHGVYMSGGYITTFEVKKASSDNVVANNYIHHVGVLHKGVAGVAINGIGIRVAHNYIHDGPRWGIFTRGNDHQIEYNHIRHVNVETCDTGAINTCDRDWTMNGTTIEYNLIHDVIGYQRVKGVWRTPAFAFGIYLDDYTSGIEVRGNITFRTPGAGMYVHSGKDNVIENNMFLETREESIFVLGWKPQDEYRTHGTTGLSLTNTRYVRNIIGSKQSSNSVYKFCIRDYDNLMEKGNEFDHNVLYGDGINADDGAEPFIKVLARDEDYSTRADHDCWQVWKSMGHDANSLVADPRFVNAEQDDYRLLEGSPALTLGFIPIPVEKIGLYESENRASWPIVEAAGVREKPMEREKRVQEE